MTWVYIATGLAALAGIVWCHKWYHERTHLFVVRCPWCRHDSFRLNLMAQMLQEKQPHEIEQWVGVYTPQNETGDTNGQ